MGGVQILGRLLGNPGKETAQRIFPALLQIWPEQPALVQDFQAAGVQAAGADNGGGCIASVQEQHINTLQGQFTGEERSSRAGSDHNHVPHDGTAVGSSWSMGKQATTPARPAVGVPARCVPSTAVFVAGTRQGWEKERPFTPAPVRRP